MFEYKGFKIERLDDMNVGLYRWGKTETIKHGKRTGESREEWKFLGYYNTFLGALKRMYDMLLENGSTVEELKDIAADFKREFNFVVLEAK